MNPKVETNRTGKDDEMCEIKGNLKFMVQLSVLRQVFTVILLTVAVTCSSQIESDEELTSDPSTEDTIAESTSDSEQEASPEDIDEITVIAHPLSAAGVRTTSDFDVISLDLNNLDRVRSENLADVVAQVSGVRNSPFGPGSSHPVIHGLDGPRILVLYDRLRPMDIATTPGDHPPLVEPFIANRVEILKGPNTLLYGSGASGGVINTETGRIPRGIPAGGSEYAAEVRSKDNSNRDYLAGHIDFALEDIVVHLDGFSRIANNYDIPGCALSDALIAQREEGDTHDDDHEDDDHHDEEVSCGTLPDSDVENQGGSMGISLVRDWGFVGFAFANSRSIFGIPVEHEHHEEHGDDEDEGHDEEDMDEEDHKRVHVDLDYSRFDWEVGLNDPSEYVQSLSWRIGFSDYSHDELEADTPVSSFRRSDAIDSRLVVTTPKIGNWTNAFGLQYNSDNFKFSSETGHSGDHDEDHSEIHPEDHPDEHEDPITTTTLGAFWVGHIEFDKVDYQVGLRMENIIVDDEEHGEKEYSLLSASGGFILPLSPELTFDASFDLSARAPLSDELFVEGVHLATGSHLEANPDLSSEDFRALNLSLEYDVGRLQASISSYFRWTNSFIYDTPTGEIEDGLPVYQYRQNDAIFFGSDVTVKYHLYDGENWIVNSHLGYDFVEAKLDRPDNDVLPREPANRFFARLEALRQQLTVVVGFEHHAEVSETADSILPTDSYTDLSLDVEYSLNVFGMQGKVFLQCKNLMDSEQRPHTSLIKDSVPLPGRSLEVGFRIRG